VLSHIWVKSESDLGQISTRSLTSSNQSWYARNICKQSCIALNMIIKERYIMKDARHHREFCKYAQIILRAVKSTKLNFLFNQLSIIYNNIDLKFQRNLMISTLVIKINDFLCDMNNRKYIWWKLAAKYWENIKFSISTLNINCSTESSNQRSNDQRDNRNIDHYNSSNSQLNFQWISKWFQTNFKIFKLLEQCLSKSISAVFAVKH